MTRGPDKRRSAESVVSPSRRKVRRCPAGGAGRVSGPNYGVVSRCLQVAAAPCVGKQTRMPTWPRTAVTASRVLLVPTRPNESDPSNAIRFGPTCRVPFTDARGSGNCTDGQSITYSFDAIGSSNARYKSATKTETIISAQ